jgi:hypothetical protein
MALTFLDRRISVNLNIMRTEMMGFKSNKKKYSSSRPEENPKSVSHPSWLLSIVTLKSKLQMNSTTQCLMRNGPREGVEGEIPWVREGQGQTWDVREGKALAGS